MDNENKSKYESTIKWVIEHYPFDKISNIFDITQNISDLKLPEEELGKVFDEYLKNNYELKEGKKYLKYTQDDYERIEKKLRQTILDHGGSLTHHHGVGKLRQGFLSQLVKPVMIQTAKAVKRSVDPENIFGLDNGLITRD